MEASDLVPRGRALVVADVVIALALSLVTTVWTVAFEGPAALAERVPWTAMLAIFCWLLYAGYRAVRWLWVLVSLGYVLSIVYSLASEGGVSLAVGLPMAAGYAFVALTLAFSPAVRWFLAARAERRVADRRELDAAYTAVLALVGLAYMWALGGVRETLGWSEDQRLVTLLMVVTLAGAGVVYLLVAVLRVARVSFARLATTVVSFLLAVQFPYGTVAFVYWLVKVREREREMQAA